MENFIIEYLHKTYPKLSDTNIRLLVGQAKLESGNFTSNYFKNLKNIYGILFVNQKFANGYEIRKNDGYKFAKYNSYIDSINDRMRLYYVLYPDIIESNDEERILNTWLKSYLGKDAKQSTIDNYKKLTLQLAPKSIVLKKKFNIDAILIFALCIAVIKKIY